MTITKDYKVETSSWIKQEFQNGRKNYQYYGKYLKVLPERY
jgi:hypothetical protein